ncbi:ABC transporter substrate-binding protein [Paeniglutamicibacter cryotolerans]|uniref:ABC transporter substrate-binding protein n=1 Tax=Paeniglutamicibacter cryotolerans TaxID=670079 RepID=UPI0031EC5FAC
MSFAQDKGYFEAEGLKVETSVVANPPAGIAAAQSGQLDLTYTPSIPLLNALSQNVKLKIVAAADGYAPDAMAKAKANGNNGSIVDDTGLLVGKDSGVASAKELEGKNVSVPARKAQLEVTISNTIKEAGGDPSKVNWMVLDPASALQSLQQGRIDAAGLVAPFIAKGVAAGDKLVASPGLEFFETGAVGLWVAGDSAVNSKTEAMAGFERAINKANAYANEHHPEAQEAAAKLTDTPLDVIKSGAVAYWPTSVEIADIDRVNDRLVNLGFLPKKVELNDGLILNQK